MVSYPYLGKRGRGKQGDLGNVDSVRDPEEREKRSLLIVEALRFADLALHNNRS